MSLEKLIRKGPIVNLITTAHTGYSSIATISFIVLVIIGIYAKIINIYHRYLNKIFIMSPIMTISILGVVSWLNDQFTKKI